GHAAGVPEPRHRVVRRLARAAGPDRARAAVRRRLVRGRRGVPGRGGAAVLTRAGLGASGPKSEAPAREGVLPRRRVGLVSVAHKPDAPAREGGVPRWRVGLVSSAALAVLSGSSQRLATRSGWASKNSRIVSRSKGEPAQLATS